MRTHLISLDGTEFELGLSFGAASAIAAKLFDPLQVTKELAMEAMMLQAGMPYKPKLDVNTKDIRPLFLIGLQHGPMKDIPSDERLGELIFAEGLQRARGHAIAYLAAIVGPIPDIEKPEEAETAAGN